MSFKCFVSGLDWLHFSEGAEIEVIHYLAVSIFSGCAKAGVLSIN